MVYSRPVASFIGDEASDEVTLKVSRAFQPLGITEIGSIRRNLVCEAIQVFRDATQNLFDVPLDGYICQSPRMVGLRMIIAWVTHTDETPLSEERHPASVNFLR
jgi:hypothetical protein